MVGENRWTKKIFIVVFLFPSIFGLVVFYLIPICQSLYLSFTDWDLLTKPHFIGGENYIKVFTDEKSIQAMKNTFRFIIGYIPLILCLGIISARLLDARIKHIKIYRALYFIPVITSWVAVSIMWRWLLNGKSGLVNYLLSFIGIQGPIWLQDFFWAMPAIIIVSVWKDVGFVATILLSGLHRISKTYYEAAEIDGANSLQRFFSITLPLLTPSIYFVVIISLINSFQLFDQVMVMTNGGPAGSTSTIVEQVYKNAFSGYKMGFASAQSLILFGIILVVTVFQNVFQKRWVNYDI